MKHSHFNIYLQFGNGTLEEIPVKITRTTIMDTPEKKVMQPAQQQNVMKSKRNFYPLYFL